MTSTAPTARIGNYLLYKTSPSAFVLLTLTGETVGTYPTAKKAQDAAIALISASYSKAV